MIEVPIVGFGRIRAGAVVGLFLGGLIVGWTLRGVAIGGSGSLGSRVGAVEGWLPILEVEFLAVESFLDDRAPVPVAEAAVARGGRDDADRVLAPTQLRLTRWADELAAPDLAARVGLLRVAIFCVVVPGSGRDRVRA